MAASTITTQHKAPWETPQDHLQDDLPLDEELASGDMELVHIYSLGIGQSVVNVMAVSISVQYVHLVSVLMNRETHPPLLYQPHCLVYIHHHHRHRMTEISRQGYN